MGAPIGLAVPMKLRPLLAISLLSLSLLHSRAAQATPTLAEVCADFHCDADGLARAHAGKMVDLKTEDASERDLSVGFLFMVKRPPAEIARLFRQGSDFAADANVLAAHRLASFADFASLSLGAHGADEAKRYGSAHPGDELNLSDAEIATFAALGPAASQASVEAALRKQLWARYEAYHAGGLAKIAPYSRGKGVERQPADELRAVLQQATPIARKYAPAFLDAIVDYPRARPSNVDESFHWIIYNLDNRPTATLRHRLTMALGDGLVAFDREFYVAHGYNVMQAFGGLIPVEGGTVVFYRAHTNTDQVGGAATAMKHNIGRKVMAKQLQKIFEHFTK
jgi:hypothetical protein